MNHMYRSLWNAATASWVAAPETASAHGGAGRSACTSAAHVLLGGLLLMGMGGHAQADMFTMTVGAGQTQTITGPLVGTAGGNGTSTVGGQGSAHGDPDYGNDAGQGKDGSGGVTGGLTPPGQPKEVGGQGGDGRGGGGGAGHGVDGVVERAASGLGGAATYYGNGSGGAGGSLATLGQGGGGGSSSGGGGGGVALRLQNGVMVTLSSSAYGGDGGSSSTITGGGGGGGSAVWAQQGSHLTLTSGATLTGGQGGVASFAGGGGAAVVGDGYRLTTQGGSIRITGGGGGSISTVSGGGGGAALAGQNFSLEHLGGSISGGAGGTGSDGFGALVNGLGGAGVASLGGAQVVTAAAIVGGMDGSNTLRALAVDFQGGGNRLELRSGYSFNGHVQSRSGNTQGGDTLALGGSTNASFDLGQLVATLGPSGTSTPTQYQGFAQYAKTGTSTWTLTGAQTVAGDWSIQAGALALAGTGRLFAGSAVDVASGATLDISGASASQTVGSLAGAGQVALGANSLTTGGSNTSTLFSGQISGTGGLVKTGTGTLTLLGANSYSGGTSIDAGMLAIGPGGSLSSQTALSMAAGAVFDINGASGDQTVGSLAGAGQVFLGINRLTVGGNNTSTSFSGFIQGSGGLTKTGTGTLTLSSANIYGGGTTVSGGTLVAAHSQALGLGGLTVGPGAALEVAQGTTLQLLSLDLQAGSRYRVYADPNALTSSRINVTGMARLAGGVLHVGPQVNAQTDFQVGQTYTILTAGAIQGRFATTESSYAYLDPSLTYSQQAVQLTLQRKQVVPPVGPVGPVDPGTPTPTPTPIRFADLAQTANQAGAANGAESLAPGHALFRFIETLPVGAPAAVLASLSGEGHAALASSLSSLGSRSLGISSQHLRNNLTAGWNPGAPVAQNDGPLPASAWPSSKALPAWAEVVGHWQRFDGDGNAAQLKQNTTGLFVGLDQEVSSSGWRLGGSVGYTRADGRVADRSSESDVDSYSAAVYGGKSFTTGTGGGTGPRINVLGGLAYSWHDITTTRRVTSLGQTLSADYHGHTAQLFAEVGYALTPYAAWGLEPFAGISLGEQRTGRFQESGGFAALSGAASTDSLASTTLGLRMHSDFNLGSSTGRLRATLGWRHAFGDVSATRAMAFEGGQNFTVAGAPLARNTALLGLEAEVALSRRAALVLGYQGELGGGQRDHAANVKLRWAF